MLKWGERMHSVYANDDPYLPKTARRWRWNPAVVLLYLIAITVAGLIGAVVGGFMGWIFAAYLIL